MQLIKHVASYIAPPLTNMLNSFIKIEEFPTKCKTARIGSIRKFRTPTEQSDCCPISVLPILSKLYEKLVMKQVVEFIDNHELYQSTAQSGTVQKMNFSFKYFFSKCDQVHSFLRIWSHLLKKSLKENFIFCAVWF